MKITVSEMLAWQRCRRLWHLRYQQKLEPLERSTAPAVGSVVHAAIAALVRGQEYDVGTALQGEVGEEAAHRLLPGALRAVERCPQWLLDGSWTAELDVAAPFGTPFGGPSDDDVVVGRVDLCKVGEIIYCLDLKTRVAEGTAPPPLTYMLWNPQVRYYAVLLQHTYPNVPIFWQYVILPTSANGKAVEAGWWPFQAQLLLNTEMEMRAVVAEIGSGGAAWPNYERSCEWCDFAPFCRGHITGADTDSLVKAFFRQRGKR